jgi:hypothetical protein
MRAVLLSTLLVTSGLPAAQPDSSPAAPSSWIISAVEEIPLPGLHPSGPLWSPDGQWLSFSGPKGNAIGLIRPDGSGFRWLFQAPGSGWGHAWAPDSSRIACRQRLTVKTGNRGYAIATLLIPDGTVETVSDYRATTVLPPLWQRGPEGIRWICQVGQEPASGPWLPAPSLTPSAEVRPPFLLSKNQQLGDPVAGKENEFRPLLPGRSQGPHWNAAGSRMVCDASDRIAVWAPLTPEATVLCPGQKPALSPDGQWIVYQLTRDHTHEPGDANAHTADTLPHLHSDRTNHRIVESDLWLIRPDGTGRHSLTQTPDLLEVEPAWSPDGRRIVCRVEGQEVLRILTLKESPP